MSKVVSVERPVYSSTEPLADDKLNEDVDVLKVISSHWISRFKIPGILVFEST